MKKCQSTRHPCVGLLQDANWWGKTKEMLTLKKVLEKMPDITFYWAGDGPYREKITDELEEYENFHWLGRLEYPDKVRDYLSEIDIYAIITGMDTTPLSLKEAQLMEKPVIATDVGGNSEIMIDGKTGFLVKEGDSNDIIQKISSFENDNSLAVNMGKSGKEFIQNEYSLNASAENFLRIIKPYIQKN